MLDHHGPVALLLKVLDTYLGKLSPFQGTGQLEHALGRLGL